MKSAQNFDIVTYNIQIKNIHIRKNSNYIRPLNSIPTAQFYPARSNSIPPAQTLSRPLKFYPARSNSIPPAQILSRPARYFKYWNA